MVDLGHLRKFQSNTCDKPVLYDCVNVASDTGTLSVIIALAYVPDESSPQTDVLQKAPFVSCQSLSCTTSFGLTGKELIFSAKQLSAACRSFCDFPHI